ncbi:hypothetical protein ACFV0D_06465, partial [Streptomyces sp. NPDC059556]
MRPRGVQLAAGVLCALVLAGAAGCGRGEGGLESAGATPAAAGPVRLWPDLPPATDPPIDYGETDTERVPGIKVADNDVHAVDARAVVDAEVGAHPRTDSGADGRYAETARPLKASGPPPAAGPRVVRPRAQRTRRRVAA